MNKSLSSESNHSEVQENAKNQRPSDIRKQVKHYHESRDEWKQRNAKKRTEIQILMTKNSRLEKRLVKAKESSLTIKKTLKETQTQLTLTQEENKTKDQEIESLKKKLR